LKCVTDNCANTLFFLYFQMSLGFFCSCMGVFNEEERERCYKRLHTGGRIELLDYFKMQPAFGKSLRTHALFLKIACMLEC